MKDKYRCPMCDTKFKTYKKLGMHMVYFHGDRKNTCPDYLKARVKIK